MSKNGRLIACCVSIFISLLAIFINMCTLKHINERREAMRASPTIRCRMETGVFTQEDGTVFEVRETEDNQYVIRILEYGAITEETEDINN